MHTPVWAFIALASFFTCGHDVTGQIWEPQHNGLGALFSFRALSAFREFGLSDEEIGKMSATELAAVFQMSHRQDSKVNMLNTATHTSEMNLACHSAGLQNLDHKAARERLFQRMMDYIEDAGIPGDVLDLGVHVGKSARAFAAALVRRRSERTLWMYDSWEGLPEAEPEDGEHAKFVVGWGKDATMEHVRSSLLDVGLSEEFMMFRKGYFNHTFVEDGPETVALLHVDSDFYKPSLLSLQRFYSSVPVGGVVIFDDFGEFEGQRVAFYRFFADLGEYPLLERNGHSQAWLIKGKETNRYTEVRHC